MLYTKTGDKGKTSLIGGRRVPKTHIRLETYGTIDELNSFVGWLTCVIEETVTKIFWRSFNTNCLTYVLIWQRTQRIQLSKGHVGLPTTTSP